MLILLRSTFCRSSYLARLLIIIAAVAVMDLSFVKMRSSVSWERNDIQFFEERKWQLDIVYSDSFESAEDFRSRVVEPCLRDLARRFHTACVRFVPPEGHRAIAC